MEHKSEDDINFNWRARYNHQGVGAETLWLGNESIRKGHLNYIIVEIGLNTEKSPGDLRRLCCHTDSNKKPSANVGMKNSQTSKIIIGEFWGFELRKG